MVRRYHYGLNEDFDLEVRECRNGEYALYSDYEILERRLTELQEAVRTLRKLEQGIPSHDSAFIHKFAIEEARAAVDALVGGAE